MVGIFLRFMTNFLKLTLKAFDDSGGKVGCAASSAMLYRLSVKEGGTATRHFFGSVSPHSEIGMFVFHGDPPWD